jgi:hypothetical protein
MKSRHDGSAWMRASFKSSDFGTRGLDGWVRSDILLSPEGFWADLGFLF